MMRRIVTIPIVLSSLSFGLVPLGAPLSGARTADAAQADNLWLEGEATDQVVGPTHLSVAAFTVTGTLTDGAMVSWTSNSKAMNVRMAPPIGAILTVGTYDGTSNLEARTVTRAGLFVTASGLCNAPAGRLVIEEIAADVAGTITSLVAHWRTECNNGANFGAVSFNGTAPHSDRTVTRSLDFAAAVFGSAPPTETASIVNSGPSPLTVGTIELTGRDAASFAVVDDGCSGTIIAVGASCAVEVQFAANQMGQSIAALLVSDSEVDLAGGAERTSISATVTAASQRLWMEGEADSPAVRARHVRFDQFDVLNPLAPTITTFWHDDGITFWHVTIANPVGAPLAVGTYQTVEPNQRSGSLVGLSVSGAGGCPDSIGILSVDELEYGTNGQLTRIAARWEYRCVGFSGLAVGGIEMNSQVVFRERTLSPLSGTFGVVPVGLMAPPQTFTFTNNGEADVHLGAMALLGGGGAAFAVTADACSNLTVTPGGSCAVSARFAPKSVGTFTARLRFLDDAGPPGATGGDVVLTGTGLASPALGWLEGEADDPLIGGDRLQLTGITVTGNRSGITISGLAVQQLWTVSIAPRRGTTLVASPTGLPTVRFGAQDATRAGLTIFRNDESCTSGSGRVVIDQISFGATGNVAALTARWEYHCNGRAAAVFGGVRYKSLTPFRVTEMTDRLEWNQVVVGTSSVQPVTLTNFGPAAATIGAISLVGPDRTQFTLTSNPCASTVLPAGQSCTVRVAFRPTSSQLGEKLAVLTVQHDGALRGAGGTGQDVLLNGSSIVAPTSNLGEFHSLPAPVRILDTASGFGGARAPISAGSTRLVKVLGVGAIPATGVSAVAVNVTTRRATSSSSFVTVWPAGAARPNALAMMPAPGYTLSNMMTMRLGSLGQLAVYNQAGTTDVSMVVTGWYSNGTGPNGARFRPLRGARVANTVTGAAVPKAPIGPNGTIQFDARRKGGIPASGAVAVLLNVTTRAPTTAGALTVFPGDAPRPGAATLFFARGMAVSNTAIVRLPPNGIIKVHNSAGSTHVAVEVLGYWVTTASGNEGRFVPMTPTRAYDTRSGGPQGPGAVFAFPIDGVMGVAHDATAAVLNVTALRPTASGHLTVYADDECTRPPGYTVSFATGRTMSNTTTVIPSPQEFLACVFMPGAFDVYNSAGSTHVIIDVLGYYT